MDDVSVANEMSSNNFTLVTINKTIFKPFLGSCSCFPEVGCSALLLREARGKGTGVVFSITWRASYASCDVSSVPGKGRG